MNEKEILDELRKEDPNVPTMSLSTLSHPFTRGEIIDENGVNYTIKRLTNHPTTANTDTNKQLRVEVVSQLITYIQTGYIWVSIDEIQFQVTSYGHDPLDKKT